MNRDMVLSVVRHALTFGGGFAISSGYLDDATLQAAIGAVLTLIGVVWGVAQKKTPA